MFTLSVNAACNPPEGRGHTVYSMHDSMKRLLDFARETTKGLRAHDRIAGFPQIADRLGVTSAVMTNWKRRGISKEGALDAQRAFGCNAWWLLEGEGSQRTGGWPFPRVQQARWDACTDEDRGYIQAEINRVLDQCEASRASAPHTKQPVAA